MATALLIMALFIRCAAWSPEMKETTDRSLTCACTLRDPLILVNPLPPSSSTSFPAPSKTTISKPANLTSSGPHAGVDELTRRFIPYKYWNLYKKSIIRARAEPESYMQRLLSIFHRDLPTTTTTTAPSLLMQEDAPLFAPFAEMGKKIVSKYLDELRSQWNALDRFRCQCDGDLTGVTKAKSFVTLRITHD
ncbi:hypothetical protein Q1695_007115 [Nippostrongylus brasiliensis]|nr:hypothetical protein Q1695_007115 [Nippostrongylus brasiliensis]